MNAYDILQERGFIKQCSNEKELRDLMGREPITFYVGFDPTAPSLHIGHYLPLMAMAHMQRAGHKPIALLGGGTTMVGDPSGKSDMRQMLSQETIAQNAAHFKAQMERLIDFSPGGAIMCNNADWLLKLNYLEFIRDIGVHFSVNRMLDAECFKMRMERGLSFLEMNYMPMQSYDFLVLYREHKCVLQMGGDDQWSNILFGADLIRRKEQGSAYALTFTLLTTSTGEKMGKTVKGALWLDKDKCSPYDFYQYWRNIADADVEKCLALLTFLPMDEVRRLGALKDSEINEAKRVLAYEVTKQVHGAEEAEKAKTAAQSLFSGARDADSIPTRALTAEELSANPFVVDILVLSGLAKSKSDARRLVEGGGVFVDERKVESVSEKLDEAALENGVLLRKGKKSYCRVTLIR